MLIWQWGLIGTSIAFFAMFLLVLSRYLLLKKRLAELGEEQSVNEGFLEQDTDDAEEGKVSWLSLLEHQKNICTQLLAEVADSDEKNKMPLTCWATFLDVEQQIIEQSVPNEKLVELLEAFAYILEKIDRVQEVDALFKSLQVNQSLLSDLNKMIEKAGDKVFDQVNITAKLNIRLDKLHIQLNKEAELEAMLAASRAQMASMIELSKRLKRHLSDVKEAEGVDEDYVDALEAFLNSSMEQSTFLHPMSSEFDDKVEDLKHLADYQKSIIAELQAQLRKVKGEEDDEKHIDSYDISMVRLEKSFLESDRAVKRLEHKLESLQTVKYNLSIDIIRQNEALYLKKSLLENQQKEMATNTHDIRDVFEQEHKTMRSMDDLLHQGAFTEESDIYAHEQSSKISALRMMVNESELYVEMLERDLDNTRVLRESLESKLQSPSGLESGLLSAEVTAGELEEEENLREVNQELEEERKRLIAALFDGQSQVDESIRLQQKILHLDEKIESTQRRYMEMEERYLAAIMPPHEENS